MNMTLGGELAEASWKLSKMIEAVDQRCSEKGVLRNFTKFTGKHLCQSLLNKVARRSACALVL